MKILTYVVIGIVLLLVVCLVGLRLQPQWALGLANTLVAPLQVEARSISLNYFPPVIALEQAEAAWASDRFTADSIRAELAPLAWWQDAPFWTVQARDVAVELAPGDDADPDGFNPMSVLPFLSFVQLDVDRLKLTGAGVTLSLQASQNPQQIEFDLSVQQDLQQYTARGVFSQPDQLQLEVQWQQAPQQIEAQLQARLGAAGDRIGVGLTNSWISWRSVDQPALQWSEVSGELDWDWRRSGAAWRELSGQLQWGEAPTAQWQTSGRLASWQTNGAAQLSLRVDELQLDADGSIDWSLPGWQGTLAINGRGVPALVQTKWPGPYDELVPLELHSELAIAPTQVAITQLDMASPAYELKGDVDIGWAPKLMLRGLIEARHLWIPLALGGNADAQALSEDSSDSDADPTPLFSEQPIDWQWLAEADIDLAVRADTVALQRAEFSQFELGLTHREQQVQLLPLRARMDEADFDGEAMLKLSADQSVQAQLRFDLQGVALEQFGLLSEEQLTGGNTEIHLDLHTRGRSARDLAAALSGTALVMVEDAVLKNDLVEGFGSDVIVEALNALNPFRKEDPSTDLDCALLDFKVADGVLQSKKRLVMETSKMEIVGGGRINLPTEALDVSFSPSARAGVGVNVGSLVKFVKLGGTLRDPKPQLDALGVLQSGAAVGAALSTGGLSILAEGIAKRALNAGSACARARRRWQTGEDDEAEAAAPAGTESTTTIEEG